MASARRAIGRASVVRAGLFAAALAGVAALVGATFTTVIRITVGTTTRLASLDTELSGWDRHGPALLVIAGFALLMLLGALGRSARPAMVAVAVCGAAALVVALGFDLPHLDDTGQVGRLYDDASAGARAGFWLEVAGGLLLMACGLGLLAIGRGAPLESGAGRRRSARAVV